MVQIYGKNRDAAIIALLLITLFKDVAIVQRLSASVFQELDNALVNNMTLHMLTTSPSTLIESSHAAIRGSRSTQLSMTANNSKDTRMNYHNRTLSHVVIPFHRKQIERMQSSLNKWKTYPPCSAGFIDDALDVLSKPTLVFHLSYSSKDPTDVSLTEQQCLDTFHSLPTTVQRCFAQVYVISRRLEVKEDRYALGARLMFEDMLQLRVTGQRGESSSYALSMEPDVQPIRPYWMQHIQDQVSWPVSEFWIKGSIFRGSQISLVHPNKYIAGKMHMNGNAIYNLASDEFRHFYFEQLRPFVMAKHNGDSKYAYDTDVFEYLIDKDMYPVSREIFHFFQYTDLIQNHWHSPWSATEIREKFMNTVLIHGGDNVDEPKQLDVPPTGTMIIY